jgi:hypothetical protein
MINQTAPKPIDDNSGYLDEKENIQVGLLALCSRARV